MEKRRTHCYLLQQRGVTCPSRARGSVSPSHLLGEQSRLCCWGPSEVRNRPSGLRFPKRSAVMDADLIASPHNPFIPAALCLEVMGTCSKRRYFRFRGSARVWAEGSRELKVENTNVCARATRSPLLWHPARLGFYTHVKAFSPTFAYASFKIRGVFCVCVCVVGVVFFLRKCGGM